jgi:hypothetical protein
MQNEITLQEYNILNGNAIHMVKRPPPTQPSDPSITTSGGPIPMTTRTTFSDLSNGIGMITSIQIDPSRPNV